ncbi:uncharacterized protein LOC133823529 isoform X2 [Humulus lupulus]|uniref:uncharacterized protein LOC133823529 isoform X2 n=2 Tax=Humulus lupulus TaxID=3486 RepID=UPI002B40108A|nr:uncharacterized protein LOC133823529 isoform X2 [Humulus lupulus]XP_062112331.1 uncharacterized protein LOC133823529 isoform X2 [Humulus lupulus]XP_062112332.1 uncharacterized protein LOC133823529 isoform X2 [Humulus lupulus]XP_062112333.1 uncharacterized protein LOC133823529 isoform X2 [Humulus lupulus]
MATTPLGKPFSQSATKISRPLLKIFKLYPFAAMSSTSYGWSWNDWERTTKSSNRSGVIVTEEEAQAGFVCRVQSSDKSKFKVCVIFGVEFQNFCRDKT